MQHVNALANVTHNKFAYNSCMQATTNNAIQHTTSMHIVALFAHAPTQLYVVTLYNTKQNYTLQVANVQRCTNLLHYYDSNSAEHKAAQHLVARMYAQRMQA